jgi:N-acetylmuramoyl-L-alanine amidase
VPDRRLRRRRILALAGALAVAAVGLGAAALNGARATLAAAPHSAAGRSALAEGATGVSSTTAASGPTTGASGPVLAPLLPPPKIVKDFIPFGAARKSEMRQYAQLHYGIDSYHIVGPHLVIWHYTASTTFSSVWNTFADNVPDVQFHALPQVCAHFVIDTNGTSYQRVPLNIMCRQVVGLDYTAIGIENVGLSDQQVIGDAAQYRAGLQLTRWLRCRYHLPVSHVIGHNESLSSPYYLEHVAAWRGLTHQDFDHADMNIVRAALAKLPCR